jgi:hypothetical protein
MKACCRLFVLFSMLVAAGATPSPVLAGAQPPVQP